MKGIGGFFPEDGRAKGARVGRNMFPSVSTWLESKNSACVDLMNPFFFFHNKDKCHIQIMLTPMSGRRRSYAAKAFEAPIMKT